MKLFNGISNLDKENNQLFKNISGSFLIKGLALLINLFTLPAYMNYFQDYNVLGVWFTILSILTWILTFDLGVGNGLRNYLVFSIVEENVTKIKQYISSAYIIVGIITICVTILGGFLIYSSNWNVILNIDNSLIEPETLKLAVFFSFLSVTIQFFLKLIISILNAMQKTALANLVILISNILILMYVTSGGTDNDSVNFLNLSIVYIITVNLPLLITTFILFFGKMKYAIPHPRQFVFKYAKNIIALGGQFFWVQIAFMLVIATNEIIITKIFEPKFVVEYQIYYKLFYTLVTLYSLISNPIWSATTKAFKEKRYTWINRIYRLLNIASTMGAVACFFLILLIQYIIDIWLGTNGIKVNYFYALVFAIFCSLMIYIFSLTTIANGIGKLRPQIIGYSIAAVLKVPVTFLMAQFFGSWIIVIVVNIILLTPYAIWQSFNIKKELKNMV